VKPSYYLLIILAGLFFSYGTAHAQTSETVISIPSIEVNASIVEVPLSTKLRTWDVSHLAMTVGHLERTAWFGQPDNIVLAGHSENTSGQPDIFYDLDAVQVGDEIIVQSEDITYRYTVKRLDTVASNDLSILYSADVETLTLFTCDISSYTGSSYTRRHVVIAERNQ
jgi:sortase A